MTASPSRQRALLSALVDEGVRFVVIGGHAVSAHGYERATHDVDIVYSTAIEDCERLARVLQATGASVAMADTTAPGGIITPEWLAAGGHFVFATDHGLLDALSWIAGLDHATLDSRAETAELADGTRIRVCSYADLVTMKRLAGRPRDREDLQELKAVREDRDRE
jgi:predicted nucleotidyltransferase